jgi:alpha-galactosidase
LNHKLYTGANLWTLSEILPVTDTKQGKGAIIKLISADKLVGVGLQYLLYPNLPIIRKNITVKNLSDNTLTLESVDVKKLTVTPYYA